MTDLRELLGGGAVFLPKKEFVRLAGHDPDTYKRLTQLAFSREMPLCWRAAWLMDYLAELHPELPEKQLNDLWNRLKENHPDGVKRSILRLVSRYDIPKKHQGPATDLCLDWLTRESVPVAIKAYSMEILLKIARIYPELKGEFITILEDQMPYNSAGFTARATQVIALMEKLP